MTSLLGLGLPLALDALLIVLIIIGLFWLAGSGSGPDGLA